MEAIWVYNATSTDRMQYEYITLIQQTECNLSFIYNTQFRHYNGKTWIKRQQWLDAGRTSQYIFIMPCIHRNAYSS